MSDKCIKYGYTYHLLSEYFLGDGSLGIEFQNVHYFYIAVTDLQPDPMG